VCTLTLWWRVIADAPVMVAANRDESPARPWSDPERWPDAPLFAGRDLVAGGTWLGVNAHGVICGITNRWGAANDPSRASRGLVVRDALLAPTAEAAAAQLGARSGSDTNAFGLLVADPQAAYRVDAGAAGVAVQRLAPGIVVLANWGHDERRPRSDRALALAGAVDASSVKHARPTVERLVADHEGAEIPGQAICVHGERYATLSSTLLAVHADGRVSWRDTRGNPCTAAWRERSVVF
jgi:uncharacterized protein with NRDE domain